MTTVRTLFDAAATTSEGRGLALRRVAILALVCVLPVALRDYQLSLVTTALIAALGALALTLVTGFVGLVTAGNSALLALGAYGAAIGAVQLELPFLVVLVGSVLVGAAVGLLAGLPALRVSGIYLAIATLALHFILIFVFNEYQTRAVGSAGFFLPAASIGGLTIDTAIEWYVVLVVVVLATWRLVENLKKSRFGRAWMLIRDTPLAAASQGISLPAYKLAAFVVSSAIISMSGTFLAYFQQAVYIENFTLELAIQYIAMIIIGGMGSSGGAIAGACFVVLLPPMLSRAIALLPSDAVVAGFLQQNLGDFQLIIYGTLVVVFLIWRPDGLAGLGQRLATLRVRSGKGAR
ncbi:branched-chain amino acid ABC transporter permease [Streptosporangium sp. NPDC049644]|uniref:branched-chain amino acid ABC transporter permease n=1 Tax=Streptosporangium sp. NPDC049644 TaxID=3155507 RepID=UPI003427C373